MQLQRWSALNKMETLVRRNDDENSVFNIFYNNPVCSGIKWMLGGTADDQKKCYESSSFGLYST